MVQKIYSKMNPVSCNNIHHDVTDLVNHGMVKNTKTLISLEQNIIFVWIKKILHLHLKWHILRSYHFIAGLTLIVKNKTSFLSLRNQLMRTNGWMRTGWDWMKTNEWLNPFWKMCQNVKKSSLLSKIVKDNVTVYKRTKLSKRLGYFL